MSGLKINKKRGEFEVLLGKKTLVVCPTLFNIQAWEEETDKHWLQHAQQISVLMSDKEKWSDLFGVVKAKDLITFFRIFSKEELGEKEIAELIDEDDLINVAIQYAIAIARSVAPKDTGEEAEEAPKKERPEPTKRTT